MSKADETFFTSVGCMDGRSECAVAKWGREKFNVEYADAIFSFDSWYKKVGFKLASDLE